MNTFSNGIALLVIGMAVSLLGVMIIGMAAIVWAQNASNNTIVYNPETPGINAWTQMFIAIGGVIGSIGTVLGALGFQRTQRAAKYMQTFGQKTVDIARDQYHLTQAINAGSAGQVEVNAARYKSVADDIKKRAIAADAQIKYLDPKKYLPNDPDKDPEMPRENTVDPNTPV